LEQVASACVLINGMLQLCTFLGSKQVLADRSVLPKTVRTVIPQTETIQSATLKAHQRATCGLTVAVVLFVSEQCY